MKFLDSWVWLAYFLNEETSDRAEEIIFESDEILIALTVLMEVRYRFLENFDREKAERLTSAIRSMENVRIMPLNEEVAVKAADIRHKYYSRGEVEISYADSVHVACAQMTGCEKLYSGDPDFVDVEEVEVNLLK